VSELQREEEEKENINQYLSSFHHHVLPGQ
jgi:hypothetical protein